MGDVDFKIKVAGKSGTIYTITGWIVAGDENGPPELCLSTNRRDGSPVHLHCMHKFQTDYLPNGDLQSRGTPVMYELLVDSNGEFFLPHPEDSRRKAHHVETLVQAGIGPSQADLETFERKFGSLVDEYEGQAKRWRARQKSINMEALERGESIMPKCMRDFLARFGRAAS